jgi:penicillin-binding protein 2
VELAYADGELKSVDRRLELASLKALLDRRVLVDRASNAGEHGYYPPGSVMKVFSALCILTDGIMDPEDLLTCNTRKYHGPINMHSALVQSCNAYFWSASQKIGHKRLVECFETWGLFRGVPLLLSKRGAAARRAMIVGDSAKNLVIGQGSLSTSPLEVAYMMSNLGRYGERIVPRIVKRVADRELEIQRLRPIDIDRRHVERVLRGMRGVYEKYERRDARLSPFAEYRVCGKTGTAEGYVGRQKDDNIAWFAGVAPFDKPRYAFAVFVEHTRETGRHVIPYAAEMVRRCFERNAR